MLPSSPAVHLSWQLAAFEAGAAGCPLLEPEHLLLGMMALPDLLAGTGPAGIAIDTMDRAALEKESGELVRLLERVGLSPGEVRRGLRLRVPTVGQEAAIRPESVQRGPATKALFGRAAERAQQRGRTEIRLPHLLVAVADAPRTPWLDGLPRLREIERVADPGGALHGAMDGKSGEWGALKDYGRDLTDAAARGELRPAVGRDAEMKALFAALLRTRLTGVVLVGDAGVGKTAVVEELARRIHARQVPAALRDARVFELRMSSLLAGTTLRGQFEERMELVVRTVEADPRIILFIDEIHTIYKAGGEGASDPANLLKPALARGKLRCIGATTPDEYQRTIERDEALRQRFARVDLSEPSAEDALLMVEAARAGLEKDHHLTISSEAVLAAVALAKRHLHDARLPRSAVDVLDQACSAAEMAETDDGEYVDAPVVGRAHVVEVIRQRCPGCRIEGDDPTWKFGDVEAALRGRVIGQEEAVAAVMRALLSTAAGMREPTRPVASFLFVGPTGTGKTELAKAIADHCFGGGRALVRFDMSEYMSKHEVARLTGAPPGYVGHDDEGQLTGAVRRSPRCVVLLDEIEKAHADVLNLFLQVLDEGRLTDSRGRVALFRDAVIVLTSNIGSALATADGGAPARRSPDEMVQAALGPKPTVQERILQEVKKTLRPELCNRLDIVVFRPLERKHVRAILETLRVKLEGRLRGEGRVESLRLSDAACELIADKGYSVTYGVRELQRALEVLLQEPLAKAVLERGHAGRVEVDAAGGQLSIHLG